MNNHLKINKNKFQNFIDSSLILTASIFTIFLLICVLFCKFDKKIFKYTFQGKYISDYYPNILSLISGLILLTLCIFLWKKFSYMITDSVISNLLKSSPVILFALQILVAYCIFFYSGDDTSNITIAADNFVHNHMHPFYNYAYFTQCPNNLTMYAISIIIFKFASVFHLNGYVLMVLIGIILTNFTVLLYSKITSLLGFNNRKTLLSFWFFAFLYGITPWMVVPYTDTYSMIIPAIILYLYIKKEALLASSQNIIKIILLYSFILLLGFNGYHLKALNLIIVIAILIVDIIRYTLQKNVKLILVQLLTLLLCGTLSFFNYEAIKSFAHYHANQHLELSLGYYLVTGSDFSTYGMWSQESVDFASSFDTNSEEKSASLDLYLNRLHNAGPIGTINHLKNKNLIFYGDGTLGFGKSGRQCGYIPPSSSRFVTFIRNIFYPPSNYGLYYWPSGYGKYFLWHAAIRQLIWLLVLFYMLIYFLLSLRKKQEKKPLTMVLITSFIGIYLFTMLFEASSRLLLSYIPVFAMISALGIHQITKIKTNYFSKKQKNR